MFSWILRLSTMARELIIRFHEDEHSKWKNLIIEKGFGDKRSMGEFFKMIKKRYDARSAFMKIRIYLLRGRCTQIFR